MYRSHSCHVCMFNHVNSQISSLQHQPCAVQSFGVTVDEGKNRQHTGQPGEIQADGSPVKVLVIPADEELSIAQQTLAVIES